MTEVNYYAVKCVNQGVATTNAIYETKEQAEQASAILNTLHPKLKHSVIASMACLSDDMLAKHHQALAKSIDELSTLNNRLAEFAHTMNSKKREWVD